MLVAQPKKSIIQRVFRTETGELIRATFLVVEWQGQLRGRLIQSEVIGEEQTATALRAAPQKTAQHFTYTPTVNDARPLVSDFSFLVSQPTRAPSAF